MKPIIAIDGPAASGKGTLARKIAYTLQYAHMDTGALYRAVALEVLQTANNPEDEKSAIQAAKNLQEKIMASNAPADILGNPALRTDETGQAASKVAAIQGVRDALFTLQQNFASTPKEPFKGSVLDGRDIGTVICPNANIKFFVTASAEVRAQRRTKELQSAGQSATYEAVLKDMRERDARDESRSAAPMTQAKDAFILDTSTLNPAEMLDKALKIIGENISG